MTWYAMNSGESGWYWQNSTEDERKDLQCWTVTENPEEEGWCTDSGCPGYGLTEGKARFLAEAANFYQAHLGSNK